MMSTTFLAGHRRLPDSGKLGASSKFGGGRFRGTDKVEYWEGEE